jgi:hypothetical protein
MAEQAIDHRRAIAERHRHGTRRRELVAFLGRARP